MTDKPQFMHEVEAEARVMHVPDIGDQLQLEEDWHFELFAEYRNSDMMEHMGIKGESWYPACAKSWGVKLPRGTKLSVDRVYIRRGKSDFSSVTFNLLRPKIKGQPNPRIRFWAKLRDVNTLRFVPLLTRI